MDVDATGIFFGRFGVCLVDVSAELGDSFFSARSMNVAKSLVTFNVKRIKQIEHKDYLNTNPSASKIKPLLQTASAREVQALQNPSAAEGPSVARRSLQLLSNYCTAAIASSFLLGCSTCTN
jgi:hypothetical protein